MGSNPTSGTNVHRDMAGAMRNTMRSIGLGLLLAAGAGPALAGCPDGMREFRGSISAIDAHKLYVDSRLDDNIGFARDPRTQVIGRSGWDALKAYSIKRNTITSTNAANAAR